MTPRERARVQYDIESFARALNHERNVRNRSHDPVEIAVCQMHIEAWINAVYGLQRKLRAKRVERHSTR